MNVSSVSDTNPPILIVAAEASSELYARRILEEVKRRKLDFLFFGIGSDDMKNLGLDLVEKSQNMAVVGLWEVLDRWPVISQAFKSLLKKARDQKPKAALLLDYPDFNLRLAKKLHGLGIPVIYFISPQVWAWRTGRVHLIKKIVKKMLVVFPFEKDFYEKFSVPVSFVGHPLLDEVRDKKMPEETRKILRGQLSIAEHDFLVALLPGSRHSELKYNFQTQLEAAALVSRERPKAKFLVLVAPTLDVSEVKELIPPGLGMNIRVVQDDPFKILQLCDASVVASGTATLVTGLSETPMVIMYKMNRMTGFLAKRLVRGTHFGMANLILGETAVPEVFQDEANPRRLADEIEKYIDDPAYIKSVRGKLARIKERLGMGGAVSRVVDELEAVVNEGGPS